MNLKKLIFEKKVNDEKRLLPLAEAISKNVNKIQNYEVALRSMQIAKNTYNKFAERNDEERMNSWSQAYDLIRNKAIELNSALEYFTEEKLNYVGVSQ